MKPPIVPVIAIVVTAAVAVAIVVSVTAGGPSRPAVSAAVTRAPADPATSASSSLTTQERAALVYMREEEKLARDLYTQLAATSGAPQFSRIAVSEQRHMDAVGALLSSYGVADPTAGRPAGDFQDPGIQALYDRLLAQGRTSSADALAVGRTVEETDIADLRERSALTTKPDLLQVFSSLEAGSQMHLRAFSA